MSEQPDNEIAAQPAVFTATIQVIRAATGKVEEYQITAVPEELEEPEK